MDTPSISQVVLSEKTVARFWAKVDRRGPDECWEWVGKKANGYGRAYISQRWMGAHRVAFYLSRGRWPSEGMFVMHRCDNKPCCNPAHIVEGTPADNVADMVSKGRHAHGDTHPARLRPDRMPRGDQNGARKYPERLRRGDNHPSRLHPERLPRGERHFSKRHPERVLRGSRIGLAKLTEEAVIQIRKEYASKRFTQEQLGRLYGVATSTIGAIVTGATWAHLPLRPEE